MQRRRPLFSAVLAVLLSALVLALAPLAAHADEIVASGTWGTCPWEISSDGVLTVYPGIIGQDDRLIDDQEKTWDYSPLITSVIFVEENGEKAVAPAVAYSLFSRFDAAVTIDASGLDVSNVEDMSSLFSGCSSLTSLDTSGWDTSSVTNMSDLFYGCSSLTSLDVSGWDTSSVTNMTGLFSGCISLTSPGVSRWNTSSVENMDEMFSDCSSLTSLDLSKWDTSNLIRAVSMFEGCTSLSSLDVSDWNTYSFYYMNFLFAGCTSLTSIDVSGWNTSGVYDMRGMFSGCSSLTTLDLSNWKMRGVHYMNWMFENCSSLTTIYVADDWDFNPYTLYDVMFKGCTSLVGGNGTKYDADHVDGYYFCIDAPDNPGYLTAKNGSVPKTYTVVYNANGGKGAPSPQTEVQGTALTLSSVTPTKTYVISYNPNGGSVSPASKTVGSAFLGWNTERDGSGGSYAPGSRYTASVDVTLYAQWGDNPSIGTLPMPERRGYVFLGWYTSLSANPVLSERVASTWIVTENMTVYAHWAALDYDFGDETYSFENYVDSDSRFGHCFGMSMTSSGYHNGLLDISMIGGNEDTPLYGFAQTAIVMEPICHYQPRQGSFAKRSVVAGDSWRLHKTYDTDSDWQEVVDYVKDHGYDNAGLLAIDIWKEGYGGHTVNFMRYENVDGQDRIYAYDNNFPNQEVYFYKDALGRVVETPEHTFNEGYTGLISGSIDSIGLIDSSIYLDIVDEFDATRAIYMAEDSAYVQGYTSSYMSLGVTYDVEYVMYEIPSDVDSVVIVPKGDGAEFTYMGTTYSFGEVTDETRGELQFSTTDDEASSDEVFTITEEPEPEAPFFLDADPADDTNHGLEVDWMGRMGISTGWEVAGGREYRGLQTVTRCDFAAFLYRFADLRDDGARNDSIALTDAEVEAVLEGVKDCTSGTDHAAEIAWLIDSGISRGWPNADGTVSFRPYATVARQDMAAFLYRYADLADDKEQNGSPQMGPQQVTFSDVRHGDSANHAAEVEWLASVGVTKGWDMGGVYEFRGTRTVARQDMAAFMYRLYTYLQG